MKKFLMIFGGVFLVLIILTIIFVAIAAFNGHKLDISSKAYVDENVPKIVSTWSKDQLMQRASTELKQIVTDEQITELFAKFSKLGNLEKYDSSQGSSFISVTTQYGKRVTAKYVAKAHFQNGDAEIKVSLIQKNGEWEILGFYVDSPFFLKN